jgi:hypothetical protein
MNECRRILAENQLDTLPFVVSANGRVNFGIGVAELL